LAVLFAGYWVLAFGVCAGQLRAGSGDSGYYLQLLVPVVAGGIITFGGGQIRKACFCGAALGILDFQLLLRISLAYHPHPLSQGFILGIVYTIVFFGGLGGVLGLVGSLAGLLFKPDPITKTIFRRQ
jgi:hypothetical protein